MTELRRQRGAALLAMLAIVVMGASWYFLSAVQPANRVALERSHNARVLQQAKQLLIGYVTAQAMRTDDNNPGRLPCPEAAGYIGTTNEGIASGVCTLPAVGRLPWRTLGAEKLLDAAGEPLWYIVSTGWALPNTSTTSLGIHSNWQGNLTVDGTAHAAVALILAPGAPIVQQPTSAQGAQGCAARAQARGATPPNYRDYLECQNVSGASLRTSIVDSAANPVFNDQAVVVSAADVLAAIEPVVAARMQRDVVPQLQSVYASSDWGATSGPLFPFAAPYTDPSTSAFKGTAGTKQGLLPLTAATCNSMTSGRCDSGFVQWNAAAASVAITGGNTGNWSNWSVGQLSCSGTSTLSCTVNLACNQGCGSPTLTLNVTAYVSNVGMSLRSYDNGYTVTGLNNITKKQPYSAMQSNGAAKLNFTAEVQSSPSPFTFTVPLTMFPDHRLLSPSTSDAWYWFIANKWHHVTYYAVSPDHLPGGGLSCSSNCITVNVQGGSALTNRRAVLVLGGRSLAGTGSSNRPLSELLDVAANIDVDETFQQNRHSRTSFNDRFVSLSP